MHYIDVHCQEMKTTRIFYSGKKVSTLALFFIFLPSESRVLQSFTLIKHLPRDEVIKENSFHDEGANFAADHRLNAADADEVRLWSPGNRWWTRWWVPESVEARWGPSPRRMSSKWLSWRDSRCFWPETLPDNCVYLDRGRGWEWPPSVRNYGTRPDMFHTNAEG